MRYRSASRLGPEHVGRRVTVRRRLPEGGTGDVLGTLTSIDGARVVVRTKDGRTVEIATADVVAARLVVSRGS